MIFGTALFVIGYAVFYWGVHHFPNCLGIDPGTKDNCPHYSLWQLLTPQGVKGPNIPAGSPIKLKTS